MLMSTPVPVRDRRLVDPEKVRAARLARGITQAELAQILDVTVMTVSRRETGSSPTTWEIWLGTAMALGLPADWKVGDPTPTSAVEPPHFAEHDDISTTGLNLKRFAHVEAETETVAVVGDKR